MCVCVVCCIVYSAYLNVLASPVSQMTPFSSFCYVLNKEMSFPYVCVFVLDSKVSMF